MSGICGYINLNGASADPGDLERMTDVLRRRGPDGVHHWHHGRVALGHCLLATTSEALVEVLPFRDVQSGCIITADVRLDNRDALIAALDLVDLTRVIGDGELILRAYLRWSDACLDHLLGDFAFAIWDPRADRLFCARDHFGMRQLTYYHEPGKFLAFATEVPAVLALDETPKRINEGRIADFLERLEGIDQTSTFYEEIFRLPPAHCLTLDSAGLRITRYWTLRPGPQLNLASPEAYAQAFLEVFTEAVRCRLRSAGAVGSTLSGGVDSGSIAAVASRLLTDLGKGPLRTFSAVGPDAQNCVETRAIHASIRMPGLQPHLVNHADLRDITPDLIRLTETLEEPFDGKTTLLRAVYLHAHRAGIKVVLDGAAGDVVLTEGALLQRLIRSFELRQALREAQGEAQYWRRPLWKTLVRGAWRAFVPRGVRKLRHTTLFLNPSRRARGDRLINRDFARRINLAQRWAKYYSHWADRPTTDAAERASSITHPFLAGGRERYDRVAAALAIEPRDPFLDLRVVTFCLSLPGAQLQADGWPKIILRRAMAGLLPDDVRWRKGKQHLGWTFTVAFLTAWSGWQKMLSGMRDAVSGFINTKYRNALDSGSLAIDKQSEVLYLGLWLMNNCRSVASKT
jgi:asparagine synthase (glutamine-hydrolysing)